MRPIPAASAITSDSSTRLSAASRSPSNDEDRREIVERQREHSERASLARQLHAARAERMTVFGHRTGRATQRKRSPASGRLARRDHPLRGMRPSRSRAAARRPHSPRYCGPPTRPGVGRRRPRRAARRRCLACGLAHATKDICPRGGRRSSPLGMRRGRFARKLTDRSLRAVSRRPGAAAPRLSRAADPGRSVPSCAAPTRCSQLVERSIGRGDEQFERRLRRRRQAAWRSRRQRSPRTPCRVGVSATARSRKAAAAASPPRACARPAERSSSAATSSSGPGVARARCQARRSGSLSASVASASARCTRWRSSAAAER